MLTPATWNETKNETILLSLDMADAGLWGHSRTAESSSVVSEDTVMLCPTSTMSNEYSLPHQRSQLHFVHFQQFEAFEVLHRDGDTYQGWHW